MAFGVEASIGELQERSPRRGRGGFVPRESRASAHARTADPDNRDVGSIGGGAGKNRYLVVTALLRLFGDQLGSLPLELRALVLSGVLVGLMANVVMPALAVVVARWMRNSPRARAGEGKFRRNEDPPPDEPVAVVGLPRHSGWCRPA
jgi:hypothetical protein